MTIQAVTELLRALAWPVVVLVISVLLRREIRALFGRVREIEGPGDFKLSLDPSKVEQIIEEGRNQNTPAAATAERIIQSAAVLDKREARILRALFDDDGRSIYSYQTDYYRPVLDALMAKGHVHRIGRGFALTDEGRRVTKEYILGALNRFESPTTTASGAETLRSG